MQAAAKCAVESEENVPAELTAARVQQLATGAFGMARTWEVSFEDLG